MSFGRLVSSLKTVQFHPLKPSTFLFQCRPLFQTPHFQCFQSFRPFSFFNKSEVKIFYPMKTQKSMDAMQKNELSLMDY